MSCSRQGRRVAETGFGTLLRSLREQRKYSLRELAEFSGVDHAYIFRLEKGEKESPSEDVLARLTRVLKPDERVIQMLSYLSEHPQVDADLVRHVLGDSSVAYDVFEMAAATSYRGAARPEPAKLVARIQKILAEDDDADG